MKMYIFRLTLQNLHVLYCHITLVFLLTFHVFTIDIIVKTSRLQSFDSILTSKVRKELVPCTVATSHHRLQTPTEKLAFHEAETIIISIYNFNLLTNVHQCKLAPYDAETSQLQFNSIQNVHNGDLSLTPLKLPPWRTRCPWSGDITTLPNQQLAGNTELHFKPQSLLHIIKASTILLVCTQTNISHTVTPKSRYAPKLTSSTLCLRINIQKWILNWFTR